MRNDELFSPGCPNAHAKKLVMGYALRGLLGEGGSYTMDRLLAIQHVAYAKWLAAMRESRSKFDCGFYEWLGRSCDSAFVFEPGDLVKYDGCYCMVIRRRTRSVNWEGSWRIRCGAPTMEAWPQPLCTMELKNPDGHVWTVDALAENLEPTDIPPEVFALACGRAKDCPMLKGGRDGE